MFCVRSWWESLSGKTCSFLWLFIARSVCTLRFCRSFDERRTNAIRLRSAMEWVVCRSVFFFPSSLCRDEKRNGARSQETLFKVINMSSFCLAQRMRQKYQISDSKYRGFSGIASNVSVESIVSIAFSSNVASPEWRTSNMFGIEIESLENGFKFGYNSGEQYSQSPCNYTELRRNLTGRRTPTNERK